MKAIFLLFLTFMGVLSIQQPAVAQCISDNRLCPDGSMFYYIEPVNFYWTKSKSLKGGIETDKENFFLALQPLPFPDKQSGIKLKDDVDVRLSNDSTYRLEHYDTRYIENDTVMQLLYLIDRKFIQEFTRYDVVSVVLNMKGTEGFRTYVFKLHKTALKEQLECFLNEIQDKKKK